MNITKFIAAGIGMLVAGAGFAADLSIHIRGEITAINGNEIVVTARNGSHTTVSLPEKVNVLDVSKTTLAAVAENSYLGIAAAPAPQGKVRALGVMVFPEVARGLNEGHFPWDKAPKSTMTNATVSKLVKKNGNAEMEMRFGDKTQNVLVDSATVFGQFVPGTRALIALKSKVLVVAEPSGSLVPVAQFVMVGRDGFLPPI